MATYARRAGARNTAQPYTEEQKQLIRESRSIDKQYRISKWVFAGAAAITAIALFALFSGDISQLHSFTHFIHQVPHINTYLTYGAIGVGSIGGLALLNMLRLRIFHKDKREFGETRRRIEDLSKPFQSEKYDEQGRRIADVMKLIQLNKRYKAKIYNKARKMRDSIPTQVYGENAEIWNLYQSRYIPLLEAVITYTGSGL